MTLPDCNVNPFDQVEDKGKLWGDSKAEEFAEEYIIMNGDHTNWAQQLYRDLFGEESDPSDSKHAPKPPETKPDIQKCSYL
jgi:hypothetical protein